MKRAWMLGAASAVIFTVGCANQKPDLDDDFSGLAGADEKSDMFSKKMTLVGSLDYGQTSASVKYHNPPQYRAFKFGGHKGDQVTIDVTSKNGDAYGWLTDNAFKILSKNDDYGNGTDSHIEATLPGNTNPDIITYYIIFKDYYSDDATFKVKLQGKGADYFACAVDADCVAEPAGGCCPHGYKVAVNKNQVSGWETTQTCTTVPHPICPLFIINDTRIAECSNSTHKCEMVDVTAIQCGGFINNSHHCPDGFDCKLPTTPDVPGSCVAADAPKTCGGIAGIQCPQGQKCVDNPNDSCDPAHGGADCGGICVTDTTTHCGGIAGIACPQGQKCVDDPNDSCDPNNGGADCGGICTQCVQTVLCTTTSHFSSVKCGCVSNTCVQTMACLTTGHWSQTDCSCVPN